MGVGSNRKRLEDRGLETATLAPTAESEEHLVLTDIADAEVPQRQQAVRSNDRWITDWTVPAASGLANYWDLHVLLRTT